LKARSGEDREGPERGRVISEEGSTIRAIEPNRLLLLLSYHWPKTQWILKQGLWPKFDHCSWAFVLEPLEGDRTRLIIRDPDPLRAVGFVRSILAIFLRGGPDRTAHHAPRDQAAGEGSCPGNRRPHRGHPGDGRRAGWWMKHRTASPAAKREPARVPTTGGMEWPRSRSAATGSSCTSAAWSGPWPSRAGWRFPSILQPPASDPD